MHRLQMRTGGGSGSMTRCVSMVVAIVILMAKMQGNLLKTEGGKQT
jgi:hypothetical protein